MSLPSPQSSDSGRTAIGLSDLADPSEKAAVSQTTPVPTRQPSHRRSNSYRAPIEHVDSTVSFEPDEDDHGRARRSRGRPSHETLHEEEDEDAEVPRIDLERGTMSIERVLSFRGRPVPARTAYPDNIVVFEGLADPDNPRNFSTARKSALVALFGLTTAGSQFCSSVLSSGAAQISREFGVGTEVVILVTSLYVLPYALGPILWGPLSELYGRKISILVPYFIFICLTAITSTTDRFSSLVILRFFAGLCASAPVTTVGGGLADLFTPEKRGAAVVAYSFAVVAGPCLGPVVGAAFATDPERLGWRYSLYITILITGLIFIADLVFLSETLAPRLLTVKAQKLRVRTGNFALHSRQEETESSIGHFMQKNLVLPIKLIIYDPIVTCIALYVRRSSSYYASLTLRTPSPTRSYAVTFGRELTTQVYDLFVAVPRAFEIERGWPPITAALPFIAVMIGCLLAGGVNLYWSAKHYAPAVRANNGQAQPEMRLPPMLLGGVTLPAGCFWFAWTTNAHWINQVLALALVGFSFLLVFQSGINYLLDAYEATAASAVAANTIMRSLTAAGFPLWVEVTLVKWGIGWACSLQGFVAVALMFVPLIFIRYGKTLRARSRYAPASLRPKQKSEKS